ncbi:MAG: hypothetical protein JSW71_10375 [Gemmatimonadota bacterium]|nr:MAG: hypothetical protein JSW71_10375 [Gemmatimonadota bacterium]
MNRISARVGAVVGGVRCPGCRQYVVPTTEVPEQPRDAEASASGKRWSFVWRPPSGEVCPRCGFPLARYLRRLKWIRTLRVGVATLVLALLLLVVDRYAEIPSWIVVLYQVLGVAGIVGFLVGGIGLVVGGRHEVPGGTPGG